MTPSGYTERVARQQILIVEDDPWVAMTLEILLIGDGHQVWVASNATQALAQLGRLPFDIVITDLGLPEMDGLSLARVIKTRFPRQAVVLSSGSAKVLAQAKCLEGVDSCLAKPFVIEQLRQALGRALFGAQRQRAPSADAGLHGGLNVRANGKMPASEGVG